MSDVEVGSKRSGDYDEYGEIASYKKRSRNDKDRIRFLLLGRLCGAVIGKGGENIKRLRNEHGITVKIQDTREEGVLTLSGDRSSCVNVFKEILPLIPECPYPVNAKEKSAFEVNLLVQTEQVGCVIGKSGQRIREIRDESNGKVRVYQDCLPNSNERIVAIGGEDESRVLAAFDIILKTLDDHPLKSPVRFYDPKNRDGPPVEMRGMDGGGPPRMGGGPPPRHHDTPPANNHMGVGNLGNIGGLGGLGGLGSLAGAAGILGQLGLGGLNTGALNGLGAANSSLGGALGGLGGLNGNMIGGNDNVQNERDRGGYHGNNDNRASERQRGGRREQYSGGNESESRFDADFGDMETETKITVPNGMAGAIIGKGGARIKEIKQSSGAQVDFSETEKGSKAPRTVTIKGTQRQIVIVQQMMAECVTNRT